MNPFKTIKTYFQNKERQWIEKLNEIGFDKVNFPIIIKDGADLDVVYELKDFGADPDLYFHEFDQQMELIDSNGQLWNWNYDKLNKVNVPGIIKATLTFDEVKNIIKTYFKDSKIENEVIERINKVSTIEKLIDTISDRL